MVPTQKYQEQAVQPHHYNSKIIMTPAPNTNKGVPPFSSVSARMAPRRDRYGFDYPFPIPQVKIH